MSRNYDLELDALKAQMEELQGLVKQMVGSSPNKLVRMEAVDPSKVAVEKGDGDSGQIFYSGQYRRESGGFRWEPQERNVSQLLDLDGDKVAKVLSAIGHKQRLDILRSILVEPLTGAELVERLNMGTTGQLYHHIKALLGADLLIQEDRGGKYTIPGHRAMPILLLLAASSDLLDTSDYMELAEVRSNAGAYLGGLNDDYDPHLLLRAVLENTILEHQAGYSTKVNLFLHQDGSITVADDGRGIPVHALSNTEKPNVQAVLTEMNRYKEFGSIFAPNSEQGISIPVVNALSQKLSVEIRREGKVFHQDYKHGIPQTALLTVGVTNETGTSVTFQPDSTIFRAAFDTLVLAELQREISAAYPQLSFNINSEIE